MSWGVQVLVEGMLATKCPIALVTLEDMSWGIQVLLQCALAAEVSITRLTVLGHFAQRCLGVVVQAGILFDVPAKRKSLCTEMSSL
jgi:hypothetical protein